MSDSLEEKRPVLAFLTCHWIGMVGAGLVTIAGYSWLSLLPVDAGNSPALTRP
jgi:hypothetical protein